MAVKVAVLIRSISRGVLAATTELGKGYTLQHAVFPSDFVDGRVDDEDCGCKQMQRVVL